MAEDRKLYTWGSEYLSRFGPGNIAVMAGSEEEAKKMARDHFEIDVRERRFWLFDEKGDPCEGYEEDVDRLRRDFEEDMAQSPTVVESVVLFVEGSE